VSGPQPDGAAPPRADAMMEAYGQSCGVLEPRLWARMREMHSGEVLEVRSDEPAAREGIPSWSWLTGNELVAVVHEDARRTRFYLRRK
jgi:TusA-related sulfurtransferase